MSIDLEAIRRRADAATPGPWQRSLNILWGKILDIEPEIAFCTTVNDTEFIAHAREDVPALLDEVERLTGQLADVTRERDAAVNEIPHDCSHCKHNPGADAPKDEYGCRKCGCGCGVSYLEIRNAKLCRWEWRGPLKGDSNG
jgi:hypothetical protein